MFSLTPLIPSGELSSQASLTSHIRAGELHSVLERGITPSHVSIAVEDKSEGARGHEGEREGEEGVMEEQGDKERMDGEVYCIPLESIGLGGNLIGDAGVRGLAHGLLSNTSQ